MAQEAGISAQGLKEIAQGMGKAPDLMLVELTRGLHEWGRYDLKTFRERYLSGGSGLNVRNRGFLKSWRHFVPDNARSFEELKLSIYTRAPIMGIFSQGGTIRPKKGRGLTILTDAARGKSGRRRLTQKELREKLQAGWKASGIGMIHTQRGAIIVEDKVSKTKTGKLRKNSRTNILAYIRPKAVMRKLIDIEANYKQNDQVHTQIIGQAVNRTLEGWIRRQPREGSK